ncbi:MAG TPA: tetratricopeptide repeat protein [bacterium]|nr:tetratricopeptide repeat protein [bacterium]
MKTVSSGSGRDGPRSDGALRSALPRALPAIVLLLLVLAVFGAASSFRFLQWDDDTNVVENPHLATGSVAGLAELWAAPYAGLYVPVTYTWWWAERVLSRDLGEGSDPDPRVYHIGNVLLHAACAWLAFLLLRRLLASDAGALAGAAVFAVHPLQAEVVSWVTAGKDLLAAGLTLGALLLHLRFREGGGARERWIALGLFLAALLAKPSAVAAPALALGLDVLWRRQPFRDSARALWPWAVAAAALVVLTKAQQPDRVLRFDVPLLARPVIAADALSFYLRKLVLPLNLLPDYGRTPAFVLESGRAAWTWLIPAALTAAVLRFRRDRRWTVPALWFAAALSPVLGLIPFEFQNISTVADRYAYLALLGPALAVWAIVASRPRPAGGGAPAALPGKGTIAVTAAMVLAFGLLARAQAARWRDTETLFAYTLDRQPESFTAHNNLGVALATQGRYDEALAHLDQVIRLEPAYFRAWANRGNIREKLGRSEEALADLEEAVRLAPDYTAARVTLARVLESLGRHDEAREQLSLAGRAGTGAGSADEANALGVQAFNAGDVDQAEAHFRNAVRLRPGYAEAHNNLANTLVRTGRPEEALPHYEEALRIQPDYFSAHLNLGKVLMRSTDQQRAVQHLERALEIGGPNPELERRIAELKERMGTMPFAPPPAGSGALRPGGDGALPDSGSG